MMNKIIPLSVVQKKLEVSSTTYSDVVIKLIYRGLTHQISLDISHDLVGPRVVTVSVTCCVKQQQ